MTMFKSTADFTYVSGTREFVTEASDLGIRAADPMPGAISLKSARTGMVVEYVYSGVEKDSEGDILAWIYRPKGPGNIRLSANTSVRVLND